MSQYSLNEIDSRLKKIQDSPKYFSKRAEHIEQSLKDLADVHSFWIEHPELRGQLLVELELATEKEVKILAKKGINKVTAAWNYLSSDKLKDSKVGVLGYLTPEVLKNVGRMVEPGLNSAGFRQSYVDGFKHPIPSFQLVPRLVEDLFRKLKQDSSHPVEKAIEAHVSLAGIQPFENGNKRSARLIERRILETYGYPPAFIHYGERGIYLNLLQNAIVGSLHHNRVAQEPFYEYIGGKIASALDDILGDLEIK